MNPLDKPHPRHYPKAFTTRSAAEDRLDRQVPVHPARFVVGMDSDEHPLFPPHEKVEGTAILCASYMGRVDEVSERGEVTVTLWERPNGREGLTTLLVDEHLEGKRPSMGDLLWIWTWVDIDEDGQKKPKVHVKVETRELTNDDRNRLRHLVARLREGVR